MFRKIGWMFGASTFNLKDPNLRIKNFVHSNMNLLGWQSFIISHPNEIFDNKLNAVIFCSVDELTLQTVKKCKDAGIKTFFHHMESIFSFPYQKEIFSLVDFVICVSPMLAYHTETTHKLGKCVHIDDPADDVFYDCSNYPKKHEKLTAVYSGGNPQLANMYRKHVEDAGWGFKVIGYPNDGRDYFREEDDYGGNPYWWLDEYRKCHVAICAHDFVTGVNKSVIKVVTSWANGLIPLASPIPSYRATIDHAVNGYLYHSFEDVTDILKKLSDINHKQIIENGNQAVQYYKTCEITKKWMATIESLF